MSVSYGCTEVVCPFFWGSIQARFSWKFDKISSKHDGFLHNNCKMQNTFFVQFYKKKKDTVFSGDFPLTESPELCIIRKVIKLLLWSCMCDKNPPILFLSVLRLFYHSFCCLLSFVLYFISLPGSLDPGLFLCIAAPGAQKSRLHHVRWKRLFSI